MSLVVVRLQELSETRPAEYAVARCIQAGAML